MNVTNLIGDVGLYGNREIGFGWLASHKGGLIGTGEPGHDSMTTAIWSAVDALRSEGLDGTGMIVIYAPGGERCAVYRLDSVPTVGQMTWRPAPTITITADQIAAAAQAPH
jgi:hypothetical protein